MSKSDTQAHGTYEWAVDQARTGSKIRRSIWPFFVFLEWSPDGLTWTCGPAGVWMPATFDPERDGKPTCKAAVGQTLVMEHRPWESACDWETCDPTWGTMQPGSIDSGRAFVIDGIDAEDDCDPTYAVFEGDPPDGSVRPLSPGEGLHDRWQQHGIRAFALS